MKFNSDHKMVITTINLSAIYKLKPKIPRQDTGIPHVAYDPTPLINDEELRAQYIKKLESTLRNDPIFNITTTDYIPDPQEQYLHIINAIKTATSTINLEEKTTVEYT